MPLEKTVGYLEPFMKPGDYLLVEDTHPSFCSQIGQGNHSLLRSNFLQPVRASKRSTRTSISMAKHMHGHICEINT